ncbi:hypothetical protein GTP91_13285 [Rugamonas sp. FT82W]|uniref:Uncharacterized protein n=1 Tax=Duganella vulcania TaxID=2692166 RepID=A0A845G5I8_9BURK|nr:hypothetical protein [Duganella vulcania]MYM88149.1 hypothetical protein [Duganella vulcania]
MPTITVDDVSVIRQQSDYVGTRDLPDLASHPSQRGPSCGFSALDFVFGYWYKVRPPSSPLVQSLPPRTHRTVAAADSAQKISKEAKQKLADSGVYTSLRHYAKVRGYTNVGSVFSAENLLLVAKQVPPAQYDGQVLTVRDRDNFVAQVETRLAKVRTSR